MNNTDTQPNGASNAGAITFAVTALVFLALGCLMLAGRPGFLLGETLTGHGQAWINLLIFGFGLPAAFGAVYWALPSVFALPLYSKQMVFLHYGFHLAGLAIVTAMPFVTDLPQAGMGATFIACGAVVFIVNIALTLRGMERPDAASAFLSTVCVWLAIVAFLGIPFAAKPPLPFLATTSWSAGWLLFVIAGVFFNTQIALALRVTPAAVGAASERTPAAWFALAVINLGVAWSVAAATFGLLGFLLLTSAIFLLGALIFLGDFWLLLQRRTARELGWDAKILLASVWMIPATAAVLIYNVVERLGIEPVAAVDPQAAAGLAPVVEPAPITVMALDWTVGLVALMATAVPGLVAIIFQLLKLRSGVRAETTAREKVAGQVLLASFFNYAVGAGLVVVGAWGADQQMLGLGAVFLVVGALGFLGNFLYGLGQSSDAAEAGTEAVRA
ncbi:MAG: cbb3-type cytochrome c oxidase subunit I [Chthoniobacterales bacterium]|nr:cbb3-type cytochrome c oxidase subunit I [Chthoniobacterales bacterium]